MVRASLVARAKKVASDYIASGKGVYHANHLERDNHYAAKRRVSKRRKEQEEPAVRPQSYPKSNWKGAYYVMTIAREQADVDDLTSTLARLDAMESSDDALFVYISLLRKCVESGLVREGERIHAHMVKNGHATDRVVAHLVMQLYCGARMSDRVHAVFSSIAFKNSISYGLMIASYAHDGEYRRALEMFKTMIADEDSDGATKPDANVFATALFCCASLKSLEEGKEIHKQLRDSRMNMELVLENALLNMYAKCDDLESAKEVFKSMSARNAASWNIIVCCYIDAGKAQEGLKLFRRMLHEPDGLRPSGSTFVAVLGACARLKDLEQGRPFLQSAMDDHRKDSDPAVMTAGITMFAKCGSVEEARSTFERMRKRDVVAWNAMLAAYTQNGHSQEAFGLYERMLVEPGVEADRFTFATMVAAACSLDQGRSIHSRAASGGAMNDVVLCNALVSMYGRYGSPLEARLVFDGMQRKQRDVISWTSMISAYAGAGMASEAIELYKQMDVEPNGFTYVEVLNAIAMAGEVELGKEVDGRATRSEYGGEIQVQNAVMSMYGRCGQVQYARWEFDRMMSERNTVSWNTMLGAYAQHGQPQRAMEMFPGMHLEGVEADGITFLAMLGCCSHAGMVKECREVFASMVSDFWVEPRVEHYGCVVDLLARSGKLGDAEEVMRAMPVEPGSEQWTAMLAACRSQGDAARGKEIAVKAAGIETRETTPFVLLANAITA